MATSSAEAYMAGLNASLDPRAPTPTFPMVSESQTAFPSSTRRPSDTECHILALPRELREEIYTHYLRTIPTLVKFEQYHYTLPTSQRIWQPMLSLTNTQIRHELLPLFYRLCRFHLQGFNEDGDCEVEAFLGRTVNYPHLHKNLRCVVIHGFILHSGRWPGELDLGNFQIKVDRHWKHAMEGEYSGKMDDVDRVLEMARREIGVRDSRALVLRKLLMIMRARGVFLCDEYEDTVDGDPMGV